MYISTKICTFECIIDSYVTYDLDLWIVGFRPIVGLYNKQLKNCFRVCQVPKLTLLWSSLVGSVEC